MKKACFLITIILSLSLLPACAPSADISQTSDTAKEQENVADDSVDAEETQAELDEAVQTEQEDCERLVFYVIHSVREQGNPVKYYFSLDLDNDYNGFGTGILFLDDGYQRPYWLKKDSPDSTTSSPVHLDGDIGESVQKSFEEMYTEDLSKYDDFFEEIYNKIAEEVVNSQCHDWKELSKITGSIDVTDSVPKELVFETESGETIQLPIVSANISGDMIDSVPIEFELEGPSWDDGEKRYGLSKMIIEFNVPKGSMDSLQEYLTKQIQASSGTVSDPDLGMKESDNDTDSGIIGTWYDPDGNDTTEYSFYEDGTGELEKPGGKKSSFSYTLDGDTIQLQRPVPRPESFTMSGGNITGNNGVVFIKR